MERDKDLPGRTLFFFFFFGYMENDRGGEGDAVIRAVTGGEERIGADWDKI